MATFDGLDPFTRSSRPSRSRGGAATGAYVATALGALAVGLALGWFYKKKLDEETASPWQVPGGPWGPYLPGREGIPF
jgi:membrane associated rhomboid family serine protease